MDDEVQALYNMFVGEMQDVHTSKYIKPGRTTTGPFLIQLNKVLVTKVPGTFVGKIIFASDLGFPARPTGSSSKPCPVLLSSAEKPYLPSKIVHYL